ncbi:MAG: 5-deoxy-glucuronate isomerase [Gammaproteobacteria bacterium]|nr:5-deoxy-glucuronate isomerase [Gammaproteobacteria bacterium]
MSSSLLVKPPSVAAGGRVHHLTPARAGWHYVGFEVLDLCSGQQLVRDAAETELCLVLLSGVASVHVGDQSFAGIGGRSSPFDGPPFAVYVPARARATVQAQSACELAVCSAPAQGRFSPRLIRPEQMREEVRGTGTNTRYVRNILSQHEPGESLLVVEVLTPGGHWSSYPPHKHDSAARDETQLEEIYYYRFSRPGGFAFQRVYTDDRSLDETLAVEDRDLVLIPRGYHPVAAPHGFDLYYLNVMAGPVRRWQVTQAPGYEFLVPPS